MTIFLKSLENGYIEKLENVKECFQGGALFISFNDGKEDIIIYDYRIDYELEIIGG